MGVRGELFSTKVSLQNRTYFFNVKENRLGDLYLNIVESKNREEGGFERQSVILFADDLQQFLKGFDESLKVLEKSIREKRKGGKNTSDENSPSRPQPRRQAAGFRGDKKYESSSASPRRKREEPRRDRGERGRPEGTNDSKFFGRQEKRGNKTGRPQKEYKEFAPRKKRVVIKKK